jgi:RNA polymerase sigma factor (sigma-70 family)
MRDERKNHPLQTTALDDALEELARLAPRKARLVELRYFAGLTVEETAQVGGISAETVMRDWRMARLWLQRSLSAARSSPTCYRQNPGVIMRPRKCLTVHFS